MTANKPLLSFPEITHLLMEVSPDIHICGFCKQQYNNFEVFLAHKQNGCQLPSTDISFTSTGAAGRSAHFFCYDQYTLSSVCVCVSVLISF